MRAITYFKLIDHKDHPSGYTPWDIVKNCSLTGNEIDNNFFFLRGYDFENIETVTSETGTTLEFQRVNGDKISVPYAGGGDEEAIKRLEKKIDNEITARTSADENLSQQLATATTKINELEAQLATAETRIAELENNFDAKVKQVIDNYIVGCKYQIDVNYYEKDGEIYRRIKFDEENGTNFVAD